MTDVRPTKVGDTITLQEFADLRTLSVAASDGDVFIVANENVYRDNFDGPYDVNDWGDNKVTVLRIGLGK